MLLGAVLVTCYFNTKIEDPFNTPKLVILLLIGAWIFGHLINSYRENQIKTRTSEFTTIILSSTFVVSLLISTLFTDIQIVGFIGDTQRRNGFLAYFGLVVIFLYTSRVINFNYALRFIKVAIVTGLLLSFYGLMQVSGKDFVQWNNPYSSMIATVGNPNFASALLAVLTLISIGGLFIKSLSTFYKLIGALAAAIAIYAIIKSQSRQGLVALFLAILFCVTLNVYINNRKLRFVIVPSSLLLSLVALLGMLQKGPLASILYKDSVSVRGYYWRAGIEMVRDKPFTGVGVDRYGAYFKEFREVAYPLKYGFEITSSNAHNTIIQLFSTAGIFVGISYLLLLFYILLSAIKLFRKADSKDEQILTLVIVTAWVGFQAQSFISIDNIGISVWGWLLGGIILGLGKEHDLAPESISTKFKKRNIVKINLFQPILSSLVLIPVVVFSAYLYSSERDTYMVRGFATSTSPADRAMLFEYASNVINNPMSDPYYKFKASLALADAGFEDESYTEIQKLLYGDPRNLDYLKAMAYFALQRGDINVATDAKIAVIRYDPWNAVNFLELGTLYSELGNKNEARKMFQKILDFAPNSEQAKLAKTNMEKL